MILQVFYDIELNKINEINIIPNLSIIRPVLFWDTDIKKIDWLKTKKHSCKKNI